MLKELNISNYALIDKTDIEFDDGMSVITGETGAGKSIMLGALGLIVGQRADVQVLLDKEKKCVVEATFDMSGLGLESIFEEENEVDYDPITIVRREILPNGKSRAFVNDTPVNVSFLKLIGQKLIDIHSQHQNLLLSDDAFHLNVVDAVAQTGVQLADYSQIYGEYKKLRQEEHRMLEDNERIKRDADFITFQYNELESAKLKAGELSELELEHSTLVNAEDIKSALSYTIESLDGDEKVIAILNNVSSRLVKISNYLPDEADALNRVETARIDLADLLKTLQSVSERVEYDPQRIELVEHRMDLLYSLMKKHHVDSVEDLLKTRDEYAEKLHAITNFDEDLQQIRQQIEAKEKELSVKAMVLSNQRKSVFDNITAEVEGQLHDMGMGNARFVVDYKQSDDYTPTGRDDIRFLFAANKNGEPTDIAKVASGGEMSRVMLSIKSLLSKSKGLPTIIFDEIDTGVSGEVADKMGQIMTQMADNMQVIAITHLPQVAAKGQCHFRVFKADVEDKTVSHIELLDKNRRVEELAKMLSGSKITEAALENARTLLG